MRGKTNSGSTARPSTGESADTGGGVAVRGGGVAPAVLRAAVAGGADLVAVLGPAVLGGDEGGAEGEEGEELVETHVGIRY